MNRKIDSNPTSSKRIIFKNCDYLLKPKVTVTKESRRTVSDSQNLVLDENNASDYSENVFKRPQLQTTLKIAKKIAEAKNREPKFRCRSTGELTPKTKKVFNDVVNFY